MQNYVNNSQVYKLMGSDDETGVPKVYLLKKVHKGKDIVYESEICEKTFDNLNDFEDINEALLEKLEFYD